MNKVPQQLAVREVYTSNTIVWQIDFLIDISLCKTAKCSFACVCAVLKDYYYRKLQAIIVNP